MLGQFPFASSFAPLVPIKLADKFKVDSNGQRPMEIAAAPEDPIILPYKFTEVSKGQQPLEMIAAHEERRLTFVNYNKTKSFHETLAKNLTPVTSISVLQIFNSCKLGHPALAALFPIFNFPQLSSFMLRKSGHSAFQSI
jgi:hypothetical protein